MPVVVSLFGKVKSMHGLTRILQEIAEGPQEKLESLKGAEHIKQHPLSKMRFLKGSDPENDWEYHTEYQKYSRPRYPHAFKDRDDINKKYDEAPLRHLTKDEHMDLENSMHARYMKDDTPENKMKDAVRTFSHRRDVGRIVDHLRTKVSPPIILKHGKTLHLMAGQTRLSVGLANNLNVPAKIIVISDEKKSY